MASPIPVPMPLAALARRARATVAAIDWHMLTPAEVRRLREFGLDEGVEIEMLQHAGVGGGPLACRIGRMAITFRSHIARAIHVTL